MPINENDARRKLKALLDDYEKLTADQRREMTEASVVRQFIDRLLEEVLGWPIKDPTRYQYEMRLEEGRPDLTLFPEHGGVIYVEAKKFGVIKDLKQANKTLITKTLRPNEMPQPGMTSDRTREEQQAINYAFNSGGTWAILTNFEKLRVFNARRDWLVLSFDDPYDYQHDFDLLWQLAYHNVIKGSLDALSNLRHARDIDSAYLDFINEWRLKLAQDIIQHRDQNTWVQLPDGGIDLPTLRFVVQRYLDRLVIARFAEDWLVIDAGTLRQFAEMRRGSRYTSSMDQFLDTFFRRFDEEHNSALFARGITDEASFSDDALLPLIDKLYEVRYRAMPADILGNTYEQYLGKALALDNGSVTTRDNLETRKKQGSYYTPQVIVKYIVDNSLGRYLYGTADGKADGDLLPGESRKTARDIIDLRCLDSACGSGSFLIYAYRVLADFYELEIGRLRAELDTRIQKLAADFTEMTTDDRIANQRLENEMARISDYRRLILETHLYGLDLDPQAAEIATVNLIMRAMEGRHREKLLPLILNQNVKVGNGLVGKLGFTIHPHPQPLPAAQGGEQATPPNSDGEGEEYQAAIADLRQRRASLLQSATADQHAADIADLDTRTRALADQLDADLAPHFSDLGRVRPFHWGIEFPEVFYNGDGTLKDNPGFTIIFGNPPWEVIRPSAKEFFAYRFGDEFWEKYSRNEADEVITELLAKDPILAKEWDDNQKSSAEVTAFFQQADDYSEQGEGHATTFKLFLERAYFLLQREGKLGYVIPSGIYTDLGTAPLRKLLLLNGQVEYLFSFANNKRLFRDVHPSFRFVLLGFSKKKTLLPFPTLFRVTTHDSVGTEEFNLVIQDSSNFTYLSPNEIQLFSPQNLVVLEFKHPNDAPIITKLFNSKPLLEDTTLNQWSLDLGREFHMSDDKQLFSTSLEGWPLYEGRMIDQFDHRVAYWISGHGRAAVWQYSSDSERFSDKYSWRSQYYIDPKIAVERQIQVYGKPTWRVGIGKVTAPTNKRTVIASVLPMECGVGDAINTATIISTQNQEPILLYFLSILNSFVYDYIVRFKVKLNLNHFILWETPVPRLTAGNPYFDAIVPRAARLTCTRPEFDDLWQAVMSDAPRPSVTASDERQKLRDEIDALVAHLYGLSRDEYDHILGTFPLVFPDNAVGQARRAAALSAYDTSEVQGGK